MRAIFVCALLATQAVAATMQPGIWRSVGYGELVVVESDHFTLYDVTATTCVRRETHAFSDAIPYYPSIEYPSKDRMVVAGNYYRYGFQRVARLPAACTAAVDPKSPVVNFDVFWTTLQENYAGFAPRKIDWNAVRAKYRPRITDRMSEQQLYATLGEIVQDINDPHVFVTNRKEGADNIFFGSRDVHGIARAVELATPGRPEAFYRQGAGAITAGIETIVRYELLRGSFKTARNDKLTWGVLANGVGYLRASQFIGWFPGMSRDEMETALDKTLDDVFTDLRGVRALVLDVSTNPGGANFIPHAIARRLVSEARVAWTQRYRVPQGASSDVYTLRLEPSPRIGFRGPVVVVMSNNTVSAGEELPLLLQGLKHVVLFGQRTPGALSDIAMKALPNGGLLALPNQITVAANGEAYDNRGIPPDVEWTIFDPRTPLSGFSAAIAKAAELAMSRASGQ